MARKKEKKKLTNKQTREEKKSCCLAARVECCSTKEFNECCSTKEFNECCSTKEFNECCSRAAGGDMRIVDELLLMLLVLQFSVQAVDSIVRKKDKTVSYCFDGCCCCCE